MRICGISCAYNGYMETNTPATIITFNIGEEVAARSVADYDCIFRFTVISRTAKFVTFKYLNTTKRAAVKVRDGVEYCRPLGSYSGACFVYAGKNI